MVVNIILYLFFWPAMVIDWLYRKDGGIFGGNLNAYFLSAFVNAIYMVLLVFLCLYPIISNR